MSVQVVLQPSLLARAVFDPLYWGARALMVRQKQGLRLGAEPAAGQPLPDSQSSSGCCALSCQGKSFCKLVQDGVDRSFDVAEFEDGAADAFIDIMERFAGL